MNLLYIFCFLILLFTGHSLSYPLCTNSSISIFSFVSLCVLFCSSVDESMCFDGKNAIFGTAIAPQPIKGLCLEKVGHGSYINMIPDPNVSNRVFVSNQEGKIWLVTMPEAESTEILKMDESKPFLDLTNQVLLDPESGLMGIACHPNFGRNGRFFVSFVCDKLRHEGCQGRCSCNTDVNCNPSKILPENGIEPCRYHYVVAEYTANGTASERYLEKSANAVEVRRIFTMGLQYTGAHAGQILFGPADGHLYLITGDGSQGLHSANLAQNKRSLLGKILRIDIDNMLGLYGNYSIPNDNPYTSDNELAPEVWALGFKNPWRCSFDSKRPSYFMCGDAGQDGYEEVDIVTKGGNYGWPIYEGPYVLHPPNTSSSSATSTFIFPVSGYNHSAVDNNSGSASIIGGYFYRSMTDPCLYGRYLFSDVYQIAIWAATEVPTNSGNFTAESIPFSCASDSPIKCSPKAGSDLPDLGYIYSLAEDNLKDVYILTSTGVYRVTNPSRCSYQRGAIFSSAPASIKAAPILSFLSFSFFFLTLICAVKS
ncbi:hypothetical protein DCAR_0414493 [Daucus carota subsp. sativus]|uniref:Glucose/Sorbosone dehydrogenase domain-containing protein n=1 Tax=Daucus carota subsp. sativus TaxID=79200 RepID=A0AAF0WSX8_DAUCS|nr:hypothetical protein DCAR_0414493 [Daucus carota subsp. sativus]